MGQYRRNGYYSARLLFFLVEVYFLLVEVYFFHRTCEDRGGQDGGQDLPVDGQLSHCDTCCVN